MAIKILLAAILSVLGAFPAFASDLTIPQSTLYPYRSSIELQDEFITGIASSGSVGNLGWNTSGTIAAAISETNRLGIFQLTTTAVSGTVARINWFTATSIDPALPTSIIWVVRLNTNDANTTVRIGASNNPSANPPNEGIYFEKLDADTNWFCVTRAASAQTRTDSTIAVSTSFATFSYVRNSSGVAFSINNAQVCSHTATIPTVFVEPSLYIINSAVAAKTLDVDYFQMKITGISR